MPFVEEGDLLTWAASERHGWVGKITFSQDPVVRGLQIAWCEVNKKVVLAPVGKWTKVDDGPDEYRPVKNNDYLIILDAEDVGLFVRPSTC